MPAVRHTLLAIALVTNVVAFAGDSKDSGKWTIEGDVQGYPLHEVCTLSGTDAKLTGTCTTEGHDRETTGSFDGTILSLKHAGEYQGEALTLTYTGKLRKDGTVSGDIDVQPLNYQGAFTATKAAVRAPKP